MIIFDYICYFFLYSFLGWCMEVAYAAVRKRKFVNRGLLNGCFCPVYGVSMVFFLIFFGGLQEQALFLFAPAVRKLPPSVPGLLSCCQRI